MTADTPDPVAAALAEIGEHNERVIALCDMAPARVQQLAEYDVPRLLKAVEAALKLTEPTGEVHRDLDGNEEGGVVRLVRCDVLREAITAALAGKEAGDGD